MAENSKIEWTDATLNVVTGCTKVSPGCDHCYAETFAERWRGIPGHHFENGFDVTLRPERMELPFKWRKPKRVFVNSMSDLWHADVPTDLIADLFAVMSMTPQHTYQILTKRPARQRSVLKSGEFWIAVNAARLARGVSVLPGGGPVLLPNVWLGTSVEDQKRTDLRIPALLDTPAAVRFLSCEPLLGPVKLPFLDEIDGCTCGGYGEPYYVHERGCGLEPGPAWGNLHWVIAGGESGPGARPMHPDWARSLRDQCADAGVAFHFKQFGAWVPESAWLHRDSAPAAFLDADGRFRPLVNGKPTEAPMARGQAITVRQVGKGKAGRVLDGRTWDEFPQPVGVS